MKKMILLMMSFPFLAFADGIRAGISESTDQFLNQRIQGSELIERLRKEKTKNPFDESEKLYLEDLTRKLPADLRAELCPSFEEGLCQNPPQFKIWEEVPRLTQAPDAERPPGWLSRNKWWVAGLVVGLAGYTAYSLRDKEIQVGMSR